MSTYLSNEMSFTGTILLGGRGDRDEGPDQAKI